MKITLQPIIPKGKTIFDIDRFNAEIKASQREVSTGILNDFKKTVRTWKHRVIWYSTRRGDDYWIGTKDKIYSYVDLGTKAHIIKPKKPGYRLRFYRSGFKPKSRVGYIDSYMGKQANKDLTFAKVVHHPGTEARNFSEKISKKWQKTWISRLRLAIKRAAGK